jgi:hypothetical protein
MRLSAPHPELIAGLKQGVLIGVAALALVLPPHTLRQHAPAPGPSAAAAMPTPLRQLDFADAPRSADAEELAQWIVDAADNGRHDFAIVDKRHARVYVFDASGRLRGATPVLLGYARGDHTVAGIGQRPIEQVRPHERTTPAGRFVAQPGRNTLHEDVLWVDYGAAVSMHRVRATDPRERRLERLDSADESDNRISYGCINMPVAFFEQVLWPHFGRRGGVVYVLPEVRALHDVFPALRGRSVRMAPALLDRMTGAVRPTSAA